LMIVPPDSVLTRTTAHCILSLYNRQ
jgi:hypothetical protein